MSKKQQEPQETEQQSQELSQLLLEGTITLKAATREELAEKADALRKEANQPLIAGVVSTDRETGSFTLRFDITN